MSKAVLAAAAALALGAGCRKPAVQQPAPKPPARFAEVLFASPEGRARQQAGFVECNANWCWSGRVFRFTMDPPESGAEATYLELDFALPEEIADTAGPVKLAARVNGMAVGEQIFSAPVRQRFSVHVPEAALRTRPAVVEFELDKSFTEPQSRQTRGLVVVRAELLPFEATGGYRRLQSARARREYQKALEGRRAMPAAKLGQLDQDFRRLPVWDGLKFHGIPVAQHPFDLWMTQQIIYEVQPEIVVELGARGGGAALYYAQALAGVGLTESAVMAIGPEPPAVDGERHPLWPMVRFKPGLAADPQVFEWAQSELPGKPCVVIVNYDGGRDVLLATLRSYAQFVSPDSYLVVAGIQPGGKAARAAPDAGAVAAIRQFLSEPAGREFSSDESRALFITTWNTGGWLKRKGAQAQ